MRIDFLADGSDDCPFVRIFDFVTTEARQLHRCVLRVGNGEADCFAVHDLVRGVPECELMLYRSAWDQGIAQVGPQSFECRLTAGTWRDVSGLIEPFENGSSGYQWLARGEVSLLLSVSGDW